MAISDFFKSMKNDKKALTAVTLLGTAGLCLIMISSLIPDKKEKEVDKTEQQSVLKSYEGFCSDTEARLAEFLKNIEGVGEVEVYLTVNGEEEYIYATEGKTSISENKTEEEYKYVMIGGGSDKNALVKTVKNPAISGAVVACTGCESAVVQEKVYKAVSTALGIPTGKIYVTKLK